jgi:hypothetical protein
MPVNIWGKRNAAGGSRYPSAACVHDQEVGREIAGVDVDDADVAPVVGGEQRACARPSGAREEAIKAALASRDRPPEKR